MNLTNASPNQARRPPFRRDRNRSEFVFLIETTVGFSALLISLTVLYQNRESELFPAIAALVTIVLGTIAFLEVLRRRDRRASPILQVGGFYGVVIMLYAAYPLAIFIAVGGVYTVNQDLRLYLVQPTASELARLGWWYATYLAGFAILYSAITLRSGVRVGRVTSKPDRDLIGVVLFLFLMIHAVLFGIRVFFDMTADTYSGGYLAVQQLPRFARQIVSKSSAMLPTLQLLFLTLLFTSYERCRKYIFAFLGFVAIIELAQGGGRTELFLVLVAAAVLYHHNVRPISVKVTVMGGSAALLLFLALGAARGGATPDGFFSSNREFDRSSEFEAVMGNAVDLLYLRDAEGAFIGQPGLYLAELAALIPQQLLPFEKTSASLWYLNRYYPEAAATGGGLAFGVVSEAVVGHGWLELIWRGAFVGLVLGYAHRFLASRKNSYVGLLFYVWLFVWSYQTVRATTFYLVQALVYSLLVPLATVYFLRYLIGFRRPVRKFLRLSAR